MDELAFQAELYALKERLERFTGQRLETSSSSDHSQSQPNYMASRFGSLHPTGSSRAASEPVSRTETPREQPRESQARLENMAGATLQDLSCCPTTEGSVTVLRKQLLELQATTSSIETRLSRLETSQFTPPASTIGHDGSDAYEYFHAGECISSTEGLGTVKEESQSGVSSSQVEEQRSGPGQLVGTRGEWKVSHGADNAPLWPYCEQPQQTSFGNHPQCRDDPFREQRDMLLGRINRLEEDNQRLLRDVTSHSPVSGRVLGGYHSTDQLSAIASNRVVSGQVDTVDSTSAVELSEQLATVRAQLRSSEDALDEKKSVTNELEEERKALSSKLDVMSEMKGMMSDDLIYHLKKLARKEDDLANLWRRLYAQNKDIEGLQQQVDEQDNALKIWEQSWNEVNESRLHALRSCEDWESSWYGSQKAIDRLKYEHEANIAALRASCGQKDAHTLTQKKIISRGEQQLKEREGEIERLRRALRDVQEDRDCARYVANERRHKLKERNTEISRLKEDLETASVQRSNYAEPEYGESFGNGKAGDEHPSPYVTYVGGDQSHEAGIPAHGRPSLRRAATSVWHSTSDVACDDRSNSDARRPNHWSLGHARSGTGGRRRSPARQPRQAASERDWQARGHNNEQHAETVEQGSPPINRSRDRATLRSSLPMKSGRQMASEANLHHAFKNTFAQGRNKGLSRHHSTQELRSRGSLQAYVESDVEDSGKATVAAPGELGGEV